MHILQIDVLSRSNQNAMPHSLDLFRSHFRALELWTFDRRVELFTSSLFSDFGLRRSFSSDWAFSRVLFFMPTYGNHPAKHHPLQVLAGSSSPTVLYPPFWVIATNLAKSDKGKVREREMGKGEPAIWRQPQSLPRAIGVRARRAHGMSHHCHHCGDDGDDVWYRRRLRCVLLLG